ncbi:MAG: pentapeptide repeat-containing protein, partial [Nitrospinota bacterium]|nr:pentapeptide repeat-containing protein [Nitrospinota bacterium]
MEGADFSKAALVGADLSDSNMQSADFRRGDLRGALIVGARMEGAKFTKADLAGAVVLDVDRDDKISPGDFSGAYTDFSQLGRDGDEYFIQARRAAACQSKYTAWGLLRQTMGPRPRLAQPRPPGKNGDQTDIAHMDRDMEEHISKNCGKETVDYLKEKGLMK